MKLPRAEQMNEKWQVAAECMIMAAEGRGPLMHARIGVMQALELQGRARIQTWWEADALGQAKARARSVSRTTRLGNSHCFNLFLEGFFSPNV
jgi:hypothetical protein